MRLADVNLRHMGVLLSLAKAAPAVHPHRAHGLHWLMSFGMVGLFGVSVIDSSIIPLPLPGSTDLLLILLVAHRADPFLAAITAIAGAFLGGYLSREAAAKGGEPALHRYLPKRMGNRIFKWVEHNGALTLAAAALLPPPFPLTPVLLAAGALGVSRKKFLLSFGIARTVRYSFVAWLAAVYGRAMVRMFNHYLSGWSGTIMWVYLGLMLVMIVYGVWKFRQQSRTSPAAAEAEPAGVQ